MMEVFGGFATILAISGVIMNNHMKIACFYTWIVSNIIMAVIHSHVGLWSLTCRDIVFTVLCVHGIVTWNRKRTDGPHN